MALLTPEEKAAVLLHNLDEDLAGQILAQVDPEVSSRLRAHIQRFQETPLRESQVDGVLEEFSELLDQVLQNPQALKEQPAPEPENAAPPRPKPRRQARKVTLSELIGQPLIDLENLPPEILAQALQGEQPRMVCLVLSVLPLDRAGEVLKRMSSDQRREVSLALGSGSPVSTPVLERMIQATVDKAYHLVDQPPQEEEVARFRKISDLLRQIPKAERLEILAEFEEKDPDTARRIKEYLYKFEDLLIVEDRSMQKLLSEVDSKSLAAAMKGADEKVSEKVLKNLSKRARESLLEEMDFLGTIPSAQIQAAQRIIVDIIQRLDMAGELVTIE